MLKSYRGIDNVHPVVDQYYEEQSINQACYHADRQ